MSERVEMLKEKFELMKALDGNISYLKKKVNIPTQEELAKVACDKAAGLIDKGDFAKKMDEKLGELIKLRAELKDCMEDFKKASDEMKDIMDQIIAKKDHDELTELVSLDIEKMFQSIGTHL